MNLVSTNRFVDKENEFGLGSSGRNRDFFCAQMGFGASSVRIANNLTLSV